MSDAERQLEWLRRMRDLSRALANETDHRELQSRILDSAIELTEAERGFLVLVREGEERVDGKPKIRVRVARGFDQTTLAGGAGKVSRKVVGRVIDEDRGVVTTQEEDHDLRDATSIVERRVRSVIAAPLRLRGKVVGALYLDHRFDREAFVADDLPALEAFADHAALALESAALRTDQDQVDEQLGDAMRELDELKQQLHAELPDPESSPRFGALVGGAPAMQEVYDLVERSARATAPVLISGESGTGKELVAREIHRRGPAATGIFLSENCAAIAGPLLESELFGHKKGAFSGAESDRQGLLLEASGGTLFLDEVGETSLAMQAKLLRVLQERRVRAVGGEIYRPLTCRLVVASQHDLDRLVEEGRFREDLYYRLDVLRIQLPPLRERAEDIPHLLSVFLEREAGRRLEVSGSLLARLLAYGWPGNVRELENEACRLAARGKDELDVGDLSPEMREQTKEPSRSGRTLAEVEREMILAALKETQGNKTQAARRLGVARSSFYAMLKKHGLE